MTYTLMFEAQQVGSDGSSEEVSLVEILKAVHLTRLALEDEDFTTSIAGLEKISGLSGGGIRVQWRDAQIASSMGERFSQILHAALDLRK